MKVKRIPISIIVIGVLLLLAGCAAKELKVTDAWSRPALAGESGAIYFNIDNALDSADTLLGVSTDVAETVEMHSSKVENGVVSMISQRTVPVPAKSTLKFEPGGLHIMLINLKKDLKAGDSFSATLSFDRFGPITISVSIKEP